MNRISENLRRGLAFMAALVILVSCPAEYICLAEGEGTAPVITISTPGDFAALAKIVCMTAIPAECRLLC